MGAYKKSLAVFPFPANYRQAAPSVCEEYEHLRQDLIWTLRLAQPVPEVLSRLHPMLFHLRLRALSDEALSYEALQAGAAAFQEKARAALRRQQLAPLTEAVLWSLSIYARVIRAAEQNLPPIPSVQQLEPLPAYDECIWMLERLPHGERLTSWLRASLTIEIGCLALDSVLKEEFPRSKTVVIHCSPPPLFRWLEVTQLDTLAWAGAIQEAGQAFGALARQMGLWPKRSQGATKSDIAASPEDIQAEQQLAETGWEDLRQLFS